MKECFVVKYNDGSYMHYDNYNYYGKGNWQDALIYEDQGAAEKFVKVQEENKETFIKDPTGYVKGITPESFDCRVLKWTIIESE